MVSVFNYCDCYCYSEWCLVDPTLEEERCAQGHLSVSLKCDGTVTNLQHTGTMACIKLSLGIFLRGAWHEIFDNLG